MPTPPGDLPWLAWAIVVVLLALVTQSPLIVQSWRTRRDVKEVKAQVEATNEQVANNHADPLRIDLDRAIETAASAEKHAASADANAANADANASLAKEAAHRVERLVQDMLKTLRAVEHAIDRRDKLHAEAMTELREDLNRTTAGLDQHLKEIPQILDDAFTRHDADHHNGI